MDLLLNAEALVEPPRPATAAAIRSLPSQLVAHGDRPPRENGPSPGGNNTNNNTNASPELSWWGWLKKKVPCRSNRVDTTLSAAFAREN